MLSKPLFIGLENYIRMFTSDGIFFKSLGNTFKFAIIAGPLGYILAFILAWMINDKPELEWEEKIAALSKDERKMLMTLLKRSMKA